MRRILAALLLALTLGVFVSAGTSPAFAGRGDVDSFGAIRN